MTFSNQDNPPPPLPPRKRDDHRLTVDVPPKKGRPPCPLPVPSPHNNKFNEDRLATVTLANNALSSEEDDDSSSSNHIKLMSTNDAAIPFLMEADTNLVEIKTIRKHYTKNDIVPLINSNIPKFSRVIKNPGVMDILQIEGQGIPLNSHNLKSKISWIKNFYGVSRFMVLYLIPAGMTIAITHDILNWFLHPEQRYGTTIQDILLGTAINEPAWGSHLGSYDKENFPHLMWPILTALFPLLFPLLFTPVWKQLPHSASAILEGEILWENISYNQKKEHLKTLKKNLGEGWISNYLSVQSLIKIATSFTERDLNRFIFDSESRKSLGKIKDKALKIVLKESFIWGNYAHWKANRHTSIWANLFIIPSLLLNLYALYTNGRYVETFVRNTMFSADYFAKEKKCQALNNSYTWSEDTAQNECTPCGHWPMVKYRESLTADGCLNALLDTSQSPERLIDYCNSLAHPRLINTIDLTAQSWITWSAETFKNVSNALKTACLPGVNLINFSMDKEQFLSTAQVHVITDLINHLQPSEIIFTGLPLHGSNLEEWLRNMQTDNILKKLTLSDIAISDEGISLFTQYSSKFSKLHTLNLANTLLGDFGLIELATFMSQHAHIQVLNISNNQWSEKGFVAFTQQWKKYQLYSLDISENIITSPSAFALSAAMKERPLQKLIADNCELNDDALIELTQEGIFVEDLSIAHNRFSAYGLNILLNATSNSSLTTLDIAYNELSDESLSVLNDSLGKNNIDNLILSGNIFSAQGLRHLMPGLMSHKVTFVALDQMPLGDEGALIIAEYFNNTQDALTGLWLNNTGITNIGARALFATSNNLVVLSLKNNALDDGIKEDLLRFVQLNPQLKTLNIAGNQFNGTFLKHWVIGNISTLDISNNPIHSDALFNFTRQLITPTPHIEDLGNEFLSLDERRAIMHAKPTTNISTLKMVGIFLNPPTQRALGRLQSAINLNVEANATRVQKRHIDSLQSRSFAAASIGLSPMILGVFVAFALVGSLMLMVLLSQTISKACADYETEEEELNSPTP